MLDTLSTTRHPFTGVWIETQAALTDTPEETVTPSRGCGLKLEIVAPPINKDESPLHGGVD